MDIHTYVNKHNLLHEPRYVKYEEEFHAFEDFMHEKYGINFIEIYSTKMFMKRVKLKDGSYFVIDCHFWNLFEHYLTAYYFCVGRFPFGCDMNYVRYMISNLILLTQASLQDDIPALALSFAQEYEYAGASFRKYDTLVAAESDVGIINEVIIFAFMAAILHETGHERFHKLSADACGYTGFMTFLREATSFEPEDGKMREILNRTKAVMDSGDLVSCEEMYCDFFSALEMIDIVEKALGNLKSSRDRARLMLEVLILPLMFQAELVQNQLHWRHLYYCRKEMERDGHKTWMQIERYYNQLTSRGSFLSFLYHYLICQKCGIDSESVKIKSTAEFENISLSLLRSGIRILNRACENEEKYSGLEAQRLRNQILNWR